MPFAIEVEGVTWSTQIKGSKTVSLDDGTSEEHTFVVVDVPKLSVKGDPGFAHVDIDALPSQVYLECLRVGLKHYLSGGKLTKITGEKTDEKRALALEACKENLQNLYDGKVRMSAASKMKISGAIKTEAMRRARLVVKAAIKDADEKISHYSAKEITAAAEIVLGGEYGPQLIKEATDFINAQMKPDKPKIDISFMQKDEKKVQADADKAAARKAKAEKPKAALAALTAQHRVQQTERPGLRRS